MQSSEIRSKFLEFFKKRGHAIVPSSSLVPENDTSVLLTSAGMQQFKPYYTGQKNPVSDFKSKNTVSIQKCIRTSDIEEVGDDTHLTFFEMLGNFSFGGYGKKEAIEYAHEFITKEIGLNISYVTVFKGLENGPIKKDEESMKIWQSLGLKDIREEGLEDVFWGPTGNEGPCGPTTEIYCKNSQGKDVEIWNIVFNEFYCHGSREQLLKSPQTVKLDDLPFKGIDTGMGFERLLMIVNRKESVFESDLFEDVMDLIKQHSKTFDIRSARILADHIRASVFLISDGIHPFNQGRGYILRRLIRRAVLYGKKLNFPGNLFSEIIKIFIQKYREDLKKVKKDVIELGILDEIERFEETSNLGVRKFEKMTSYNTEELFGLFQSYGLPIDMIIELAEEKGIKVDRAGLEEQFKKHQIISHSGAEKKFKGGLADTSEMSVKYHTATHLLHQALHDVLGESVAQKGSNITPERLRFDFTYTSKMTDEQKKKVEDIVNQKIREDLPVNQITLPKEEALKTGARHFFGDKYGEEVSVYFIGKDLKSAYSKEFCGGPHVARTGGLGNFKIKKEEAVSQGVRRIKAILE